MRKVVKVAERRMKIGEDRILDCMAPVQQTSQAGHEAGVSDHTTRCRIGKLPAHVEQHRLKRIAEWRRGHGAFGRLMGMGTGADNNDIWMCVQIRGLEDSEACPALRLARHLSGT